MRGWVLFAAMFVIWGIPSSYQGRGQGLSRRRSSARSDRGALLLPIAGGRGAAPLLLHWAPLLLRAIESLSCGCCSGSLSIAFEFAKRSSDLSYVCSSRDRADSGTSDRRPERVSDVSSASRRRCNRQFDLGGEQGSLRRRPLW